MAVREKEGIAEVTRRDRFDFRFEMQMLACESGVSRKEKKSQLLPRRERPFPALVISLSRAFSPFLAPAKDGKIRDFVQRTEKEE